MKDFLLSYDTVCLIPNYSTLSSRNDADTSVTFCGYKFALPVVPANMVDVISFENAKKLSDNGYFYIMHRFDNVNDRFCHYAMDNKLKLISISVGIQEHSMSEIGNVIEIIREGTKDFDLEPNFITIDVAHGHHSKVCDMMEHIKKLSPKSKLIVGNVATAEGYKYLVDCGADAVKVGIGGGSICSTRYKTGFHLPTLQSVYDCASLGLDIPIIADGGLKHYGDVAKALAFGATMVMSGQWFASCIDSPAKISHGKKVYRGSTSYELKGHKNHVEGHSLEIDEGCTYVERLLEIQQALHSSISYAGGHDLSIFEHNRVKWNRVYPWH